MGGKIFPPISRCKGGISFLKLCDCVGLLYDFHSCENRCSLILAEIVPRGANSTSINEKRFSQE